MEKMTHLTGIVAPLPRANVDTDQIIPKQFLKSIKRTGFGQNLFDEWRYLDEGQPGQDCANRPLNTAFVLNQSRYQGASILVAGKNFGCGSSREHAPWALLEFGFRVILASSFADIFFNNCFKNGILPIVLQESEIAQLFELIEKNNGFNLSVNLEEQVICYPGSDLSWNFSVDAFRKHCLINGLDDIGLTLQDEAAISAYEQRRKKEVPWVFNAISSPPV